MTATVAIESQNREIEACFALFHALAYIAFWPSVLIISLNIRIRMSSMTRHIRNFDAHAVPIEMLSEVHSMCRGLHQEYVNSEERLVPIAAWLLRNPFADLEELCEDLAVATDRDARELVRKIAAASV